MELITQHLIMAEDLNPNYSIFGGQLLAWLDKDIYIYASTKLEFIRLATASMDKICFKKPAYLGEIIQIYGRIRKVNYSSVIAEGKAVAFNPQNKHKRDIIVCEITFVAIDNQGRVSRLPKKNAK